MVMVNYFCYLKNKEEEKIKYNPVILQHHLGSKVVRRITYTLFTAFLTAKLNIYC